VITINKKEKEIVKQIVKEMKKLVKQNKNYYSFGKYIQPKIEKWLKQLKEMV
jgi:hypothetical protein